MNMLERSSVGEANATGLLGGRTKHQRAIANPDATHNKALASPIISSCNSYLITIVVGQRES